MAGVSRQVLQEMRRRHQAGLHAVAVELTNRAKVQATRHTDNGTRRNSITQSKEVDGRTVLWGIPIGAAPHAPHLELGFKPHWVPARHIGLWMQRHGAGVSSVTRARSGRGRGRHGFKTIRRRKVSAVALGLYVGGPGSTLQVAPGGTQARFFAGRKRFKRWHYYTKGGISRYLRPATVGHPILQPVGDKAHTVPMDVFLRGWARGR